MTTLRLVLAVSTCFAAALLSRAQTKEAAELNARLFGEGTPPMDMRQQLLESYQQDRRAPDKTLSLKSLRSNAFASALAGASEATEHWLKRGAELNDPASIRLLGEFYLGEILFDEEGARTSTPANFKRIEDGKRMLARAVDLGDDLAARDLVNFYTLQSWDETQAVRWARKWSGGGADENVARFKIAALTLSNDKAPAAHARAALALLNQLAAQPYAPALRGLARLAESGNSQVAITADLAAAALRYCEAVGAGDLIALDDIARLQRKNNQAVAAALQKALRPALEKAAAANVAAAQRWIGHGYRDGLFGFPRDRSAARRNYEAASAKGDGEAMFELSTFLRDGIGGPANPRQSYTLLQNAANTGFAPAQIALGKALLQGYAAPRDPAAAFRVFEQAANAGNEDASAWLGRCLVEGFGTTRDVERGLRLLEAAAKGKLPDDPMARISAEMDPESIGSAEANFLLGALYNSGRGVTKDTNKAYSYFMAANRRGHPEVPAMFPLGKNPKTQYPQPRETGAAFASRAGGLYRAGNATEALRIVQVSLEIYPHNPVAWQIKATLDVERGDYAAAARALSEYQALSFEDDATHVFLWSAEARAFGVARANTTLDAYLAARPGNDWPRPVLLFLRDQIKDEQLFTEAAKGNGDERAAIAAFARGAKAAATGAMPEALQFFREATTAQRSGYEAALAKAELKAAATPK